MRAHALRLEPGCSLWLSHTRLPETRMLVQGEHFTWEPPHRNRLVRSSEFNGHGDPSAAARFTACVPLLISLHEPWANFLGGVTIGHLRLARETRDEFELVCNHLPEVFMSDPGKEIKMALRENNRPDHLVAGGPAFAVAYHDERVIPAFWYREGTETMPFTYIIGQDEIQALQLAWRQQGRVIREAAENPYAAEEGRMGVVPSGKLRFTILKNARIKGQPKDVQVNYDDNGVVFGLSIDGKAVGSCSPAPGVTLALRSMITHREIRAHLMLPSLETGMVEPIHDARIIPSVNSMASAFSDAEKIAALTPRVKEVPNVVRRAVAPKLTDVVVEAELAEEQHEEAEAFFDALPATPEEVIAEEVAVSAEIQEVPEETPAEELAAVFAEQTAQVNAVMEAAEHVVAEAQEAAAEAVADTNPDDLTELEMSCFEALGLLHGKVFNTAVYTGDGRVIVASGKVVGLQELVNLVAHNGDWVGDEDELMLARVAIMEAEEGFVPETDDSDTLLTKTLVKKQAMTMS